MDRYERVMKPGPEIPINENEIRITAQGRIGNYISYATTLLLEKGCNEISLKAMGRAINKTVMIAELIKRRFVDLYQNTSVGSADITDMWEPLEEGLLPLETIRHVSVIAITLSKIDLDTCSSGYQPPIPRDQVKPHVDYDYEGDKSPRRSGRGRGGRGRGYYGVGRARVRGSYHGNGRDEKIIDDDMLPQYSNRLRPRFVGGRVRGTGRRRWGGVQRRAPVSGPMPLDGELD